MSIGETILIIFVRKREERKSQAAEYEQFIAERARLERAAEEKRKQARKIEQKAKGSSKKKSTEDGGRLAHQKSIGSKEKRCIMLLKP